MKMIDEIKLPDVRALVAFGKIGMRIIASRMLSLLSSTWVVAISAYSIYASSWQGAVCVGIIAFFVFIPSLKAESKHDTAEN